MANDSSRDSDLMVGATSQPAVPPSNFGMPGPTNMGGLNPAFNDLVYRGPFPAPPPQPIPNATPGSGTMVPLGANGGTSGLPSSLPVTPSSSGAGFYSGANAGPSNGNVLGPTDPFDIANIVNKVTNLPAYQQPYQQLQNLQGQEQDVMSQMRGMPTPKMGPQIEHGAGFLHNLGQALLIAANVTRPGQAVNEAIYGPGIRQYGAKQTALANQLKGLQEQEQIPAEELRSMQGLATAGGLAAYRGGQLDVRNRQADIQQQRADTYAQYVQQKGDWQAYMKGLNDQKLSLQQKALAIRQRLGELGIQVQEDRNGVMLSLGDQRVQLGADEFNAKVQNNDAGWFDQAMIGLGLKKPAQTTQGQTAPYSQPGTSPAAPPSGGPPKKGKTAPPKSTGTQPQFRRNGNRVERSVDGGKTWN